MIVLSLDCSSAQTGWAVYDCDKQVFIQVGHFTYKNPHTVYLEFKRDIMSLLIQYNPDHVIAEDCYLGLNPHTYRVLCRLQGILMATVQEHNFLLTLDLVMPSEWRKKCAVAYKKKMNFRKSEDCKQASVELATSILAGRLQVLSDDCADAVCILASITASVM
jgi:Holliday junction resolvasome RuvABC endonuclease subunit